MQKPSTYRMLKILRANEQACRVELAAIYGADYRSAAVAQSLNTILKLGWASVDRSTIGRNTKYNLTKKGHRALDLIDKLEAIE